MISTRCSSGIPGGGLPEHWENTGRTGALQSTSPSPADCGDSTPDGKTKAKVLTKTQAIQGLSKVHLPHQLIVAIPHLMERPKHKY